MLQANKGTFKRNAIQLIENRKIIVSAAWPNISGKTNWKNDKKKRKEKKEGRKEKR